MRSYTNSLLEILIKRTEEQNVLLLEILRNLKNEGEGS